MNNLYMRMHDTVCMYVTVCMYGRMDAGRQAGRHFRSRQVYNRGRACLRYDCPHIYVYTHIHISIITIIEREREIRDIHMHIYFCTS